MAEAAIFPEMYGLQTVLVMLGYMFSNGICQFSKMNISTRMSYADHLFIASAEVHADPRPFKSNFARTYSRWGTDSICMCVTLFLSCDKAALRTFFPSVHPSVTVAVCLFVNLFHNVPPIVSCYFRELLPLTKVMSMQKVKVKGQVQREVNTNCDPIWAFPDCSFIDGWG